MVTIAEEHRSLIEQLKRLLIRPNFAHHFLKLTENHDSKTRQLIKTELKRMTTPCYDHIDLRGKTVFTCEKFSYQGFDHYLDKQALNDFYHSLMFFGQKYTLGVYEHVMYHFLLRRSDSQTPYRPILPTTNSLKLGRNLHKQEQKIIYSMNIKMKLPDTETWINGITTEVSMYSVIIRIPFEMTIKMNQIVHVSLLNIGAKELDKILQAPTEYQVIHTKTNSQYQWLTLARLNGHKAFSEKLQALIELHKQNNMNIDRVLSAVTVINYERQYLPCMTCLPIFLSHENLGWIPLYSLRTQKNNHIIDYFQGQEDENYLTSALTTLRLKNLLTAYADKHQIWYSFQLKNAETTQIYLASLYELEKHKLKELFFKFASNKKSWRVFHVAIKPKQAMEQQFRFSVSQQDNPISPVVSHQISELNWVFNITDITNDYAQKHYQHMQSDEQPSLLKKFELTNSKPKIHNIISTDFFEERIESTFSLHFSVQVKQGSETWLGMTAAVSPELLVIHFKRATNLLANKRVYITFPVLNQETPSHRLSKLPYRVVAHDKHTITLEAVHKENKHQGMLFFQKIIKKQPSLTQTIAEYTTQHRDMYEVLKNIFFQNTFINPFFVHMDQNKIHLDLICRGQQTNRFMSLFHVNHPFNDGFDFSSMFDEEKIKRLILHPLNRLDKKETSFRFEIFLSIQQISRHEVSIDSVVSHEINRIQQQKFIEKSESVGEFMAILFIVQRPVHSDFKYLLKEMTFVKKNSPHAAKKIKERIDNIQAQGECIDVTFEAKQRFYIQPSKPKTGA